MAKGDAFWRTVARKEALKKAERDGIVADSMKVRRALVAKMDSGEATLEEIQAELKQIQRGANAKGLITRTQAYKAPGERQCLTAWNLGNPDLVRNQARGALEEDEMTTEAKWLGLALRSESDQPHEWPAIGWVIRNRVLKRGYPSSYFKVITQPWQFSYFNKFRGMTDSEALFAEALDGYAGDAEGWSENDFAEAVECAEWLIAAPRWRSPLPANIYHYWSPVSMRPQGSDPSWAAMFEKIAISGIDPWRFTFARARVARPGFQVTA